MKQAEKLALLRRIRTDFGNVLVVDKSALKAYVDGHNIKANWLFYSSRSAGRGKVSLEDAPNGTTPPKSPAPIATQPPVSDDTNASSVAMVAQVVPLNPQTKETVTGDSHKSVRALELNTDFLVPKKSSTFVKFGPFADIKKLIQSRIFYPIYITGHTGNGKTFMVEQACAELNRELIRVNITEETCEEDLIGGNVLRDGNVVYQEGPVLTAMRRGAVLLLDEVDLNATKILCMQPVLEGAAFFVKKTGQVVVPQPGFNIVATANTKGKGSVSAISYVGTKLMNEAFLERFPVMFQNEYPSEDVERRILMKNMVDFGLGETDETKLFAQNLVTWAAAIRKTFDEEAVDENMSTRRLVAIIKAFSVFHDQKKAIKLCLTRFSLDNQDSFFKLYEKVEQVELKKIEAAKAREANPAGNSNIDVARESDALRNAVEQLLNERAVAQ